MKIKPPYLQRATLLNALPLSTGGKFIGAEPFASTSGGATETDDAFVLTKIGCLEAVARVDFDGELQSPDSDWAAKPVDARYCIHETSI